MNPKILITPCSGCLEFREREQFLNGLSQSPEDKKLKTRIKEEQDRIATVRTIFEAEGLTTVTGKLVQSLKNTLSPQLRRKLNYSHLETPTPTANPNDRRASHKILEDDLVLSDLKANIIYFKKEGRDQNYPRPYDHPNFEDTFPNQKIPLGLLLKDDEKKNPLMWDCEDGMIRYFHIPANNMTWCEVGLLLYFSSW